MAVELDDEPLGAPDAVALKEGAVDAQVNVDLRPGKCVRIEEGQEALLERAAGHPVPGAAPGRGSI